MTASLTDTRSAELYRRALHVLPGGVNSPVRAMRSIGRDPIFVERAAGAEITDVDGNVYVDYVCSWGPLIHGHAHPVVLEAIAEAAALGGAGHRCDHVGMRVTGDQRAPGLHPVDVAVAVDVDQLGALAARHEDRVAADRAHRAYGRVDPAGEQPQRALVELGAAQAYCASHSW